MSKEIILASQSPRRKQLLTDAEIAFTVQSPDIEEHFPDNIPLHVVPEYIARNKAMAIARNHKDKIVIAADTVVILEGSIIGKPKDKADAMDILKSLSGKRHEVVTGVVIAVHDTVTTLREITGVYFRPLTEVQIAHYIDNYQPYDKAGAYAIQEWIGLVGIEKIEGDFYNVMGLPVSRVVDALCRIGTTMIK
jgi:septum formation protein